MNNDRIDSSHGRYELSHERDELIDCGLDLHNDKDKMSDGRVDLCNDIYEPSHGRLDLKTNRHDLSNDGFELSNDRSEYAKFVHPWIVESSPSRGGFLEEKDQFHFLICVELSNKIC
jgi:hypothetical protein